MRLKPSVILSLISAGFAVLAGAITVFALARQSTIGFDIFCFWAILPYAGLFVMSLLSRPHLTTATTALVGTLLIGGYSLYCLFVAFFQSPDPQSSLVANLGPALQWIACGVLLGVILLVFLLKWVILPQRLKAA